MAHDDVDVERKRARSEDSGYGNHKKRRDDAGRQIYMGNLDFRTEKAYIEKELSVFGELTDIFMPLDNRGEPRGFAFVTFLEKESAEEAARRLDGREFDGRSIKVNIARPRPQSERSEVRERRSPPREVRRQGRIFIDGLPDDVRERELEDLYHRCGRIHYIELRKVRFPQKKIHSRTEPVHGENRRHRRVRRRQRRRLRATRDRRHAIRPRVRSHLFEDKLFSQAHSSRPRRPLLNKSLGRGGKEKKTILFRSTPSYLGSRRRTNDLYNSFLRKKTSWIIFEKQHSSGDRRIGTHN